MKRRFSNQCNKAEKLKGYVDGLKEQLELLERSVDGSALRYKILFEKMKHSNEQIQARRVKRETAEILHAFASSYAEAGSTAS